MQWQHWLLGGGLLMALRHVGFGFGFGAQVFWEGFVDGAAARKAVNKDPTGVVDILRPAMAGSIGSASS